MGLPTELHYVTSLHWPANDSYQLYCVQDISACMITQRMLIQLLPFDDDSLKVETCRRCISGLV
jgi:hypothetical protein